MTAPPKHRLRWYQYSLRSLFVLMVLVAIAGSWFAVKRQQKERERAAVRWIMELGGRVEYDYQFDGSEEATHILFADEPGPAWLRAWLGDDFFASVVVVTLSDSSVADGELEQLQNLPRLERLYLKRTAVTDIGLEQIARLTQLRELRLFGTQVTDAGVACLCRLPHLECLCLEHTQVSDVGLEHLTRATQLRRLDLYGANVTDEGIKMLHEALPNCTIVR